MCGNSNPDLHYLAVSGSGYLFSCMVYMPVVYNVYIILHMMWF